MIENKFPDDCPENCPYFHDGGLSDEDQYFFCDLIGVEIYGYTDDYCFCPIKTAVIKENNDE